MTIAYTIIYNNNLIKRNIKMNVIGINLKADLLRIVTLSGTKSNHVRIEEKFNKIKIPRDNNISELTLVKDTLITFFNTNNIEGIAVNGRAIAGQMSGSPLSFKSEGFLIAITNIQIKNIFSATIRATDKKGIDLKTCKPTTKDLGVAYDIAFELLPE